MSKEEIANIIQNLSEEELEFALQNAKQQVEVINEGLKTTESRTKLLITFLVAAIILCIIGFNSCENALYFRLFCGLIIFSYIIEVLIIVHRYFCKEFPSQVARTESILELTRYYKQINNKQPLFSTKKDVLETILDTVIPTLEKHAQKRAKIFNNSMLSTVSLPIWFVVIIFIGYLLI